MFSMSSARRKESEQLLSSLPESRGVTWGGDAAGISMIKLVFEVVESKNHHKIPMFLG